MNNEYANINKASININKESTNKEIYNNHSQLEEDIFILINYIRTNPLKFSNNLINKNKYIVQSEEQIDLINFLKEINNNETLVPFKEIPEISKAARNLINNIALNDKKYHSINFKELKPETLNLRTRLSNYGRRDGRIFETVVFKTDNSEDIVNHILLDEKGRNMLLSSKMKYIGIACDVLPSNIICSVIDIVQDFVPFKEKEDNYNNINDNYDKYNFSRKYFSHNNNELPYQYHYDIEYQSNIDKLKLELNKEKQTNKNFNNESNTNNNTQNMNIIINNNQNNVDNAFSPNILINKSNQRRQNLYIRKNKTPKRIASMELPQDKENFFSPNSVNSYNIIINNKIVPTRNNLTNKNEIKSDSKNEIKKIEIDKYNDNNFMFTMAGRTYKQQREAIEISTKFNLNKSKSVCSFEFDRKISKNNNKNKFQKLNPKEKIEILHKINQRNKNPKSLSTNNNKNIESIINKTPFSSKINLNYVKKNNLTNLRVNYDDKNKGITSDSNNSYYLFNSEKSKNFDSNEFYSPNRYDISYKNRKSETNNINYYRTNPFYLSYIETKSNKENEIKDEYSNQKISEIKNDLLLFKNQIKKELKDEVKNEIKEEIKNEFKNNPIGSPKINDDYEYNNKINDKENLSKMNILNDEVYYKKNKNNYVFKNKLKNRSSSEEKFYFIKYNNNNNLMNNYTQNNISKERMTYDPKININSNNGEDILKDKYKERYENLNDLPRNSNLINYINNKNGTNDIKNKSYFNDGHKIKNRQEIKKLIKLYNIAKDSKRNNSKNNKDALYDILNNNKSNSNYFSGQNINRNKNEENSENIFMEDDDFNQIKNINVNKHFINRIKEKNIENPNQNKVEKINDNNYINGNIDNSEIEKIKPRVQVYKFKSNNINKDKRNSIDKNEINEDNKKEEEYQKREYNTEIFKENKDKNNSTNEILSLTGRFVDDNIDAIKKINDKKGIGIISYIDKNHLNDKKDKIDISNSIKTNKNEINIPILDFPIINYENDKNYKNSFIINSSNNMNSSKNISSSNINSFISNNNNVYERKKGDSFYLVEKKDKSDKFKSPEQNQKYDTNNYDNKVHTRFSSNISIKTNTYYKPKKYIPYHYYPLKYKNLNYNEQKNNDNNIEEDNKP